jgi:cytochrome c-type biogenesis protein CcmH/NrfF
MAKFAKFRRLAALAGLAAALISSTGMLQGQSSDRAKQLGAKMVCMCNCGQILTQCNHVGCKTSLAMLKELDARVEKGDSDDLILQSFVQEYGTAVLAEPATHGFNALAWAIPGIAFALGLALVVLVIRHWRRSAALATAGGPAISSGIPAALSAERLERARREADRETEE